VVEAGSAAGIPGVALELEGVAHPSLLSDVTGGFRLGGVEPGRYRLHLRRIGYHPLEREVEVRNGEVTRLHLVLDPDPVHLPGIRARGAAAGSLPGAVHLSRERIVASGARTVGELLRDVPGVVVRGTGPGGGETVSLRGGSADAVLVVLDGIVLNDPLTGEAELGSLPASALEGVTVLPGARSARYGPGAEAGVIVLESRAPGTAAELFLGAGALGDREVGGEVGRGGGRGWTATGGLRSLDGRFSFALPPEVGGGAGTRGNADLRQLSLGASASTPLGGGALTVRAGGETLERGLPGRSYAPSDSARQELQRIRGAAMWFREGAGGAVRAAAHGGVQKLHLRDPRPPAGLPFDDRTHMREGGASLQLLRALSLWTLVEVGGGVDLRHRGVEGGALNPSAPGGRTDLGIHLHGSVRLPRLTGEVTAALRGDRSGWSPGWYPGHEVGLSIPAGPLVFRGAHRSAYTPPSLADQYFREGVGVRPNPELQAQRVPREVELGVDLLRGLGPVEVTGSAAAFHADVQGMIVWLPDFRFIWSPRNVDVKRRGGEISGTLSHRGAGLRMGGSYALARVTYDRPGGDDSVQVAYRPRHTSSLHGSLERGRWRLHLRGLFTGTRYPAPAHLNALPPFWTLDGELSRLWTMGGWTGRVALRGDRLLDHKDSLIFAFPEPGRTLRLEFRLAPTLPGTSLSPVSSEDSN